MKKFGLTAVVVAMLAIAPAVFAHAPLTGSACTGTKAQRAISLHVHGIGCSAAYIGVTKNSTGFACKTIGNTKKLPVTDKCTKIKNKNIYYEFLVAGG
jgi:hypothetical protein